MERHTQARLRPWAWYTVGAHLLIGCAWPLLGSRSYQKIMGRKEDMWLMSGVSLLFGVTGSTIARAAATGRITPEIAQLAIGASVATGGLEIVNVARGGSRQCISLMLRVTPRSRVDGSWRCGAVQSGHDGCGWWFRKGDEKRMKTRNPMMSLVWRAHAAYFILGSLWPILNSRSFQWVTGKKKDVWLVKTVALLLTVTGVVIGRAGAKERITPEITTLGIGSAASLAIIDVWYVAQGRIRKVYLLDALGNILLIGGWIAALKGSRGKG